MNHKVLLLNAGFSLYGLIQQNPTLKQQFALLGLNFGNEVMVNDRQQLIGQISQSVKNCRLLLLVDNAPELRAREILAQGFNKPLHQNEKALQDIREYLSQNGRMANARLQNAMIPQDAVPLSDPGCGQAGFALFFPQTCVALVSGSAKDVLRLVANQLFPLLLRQLYPGAVTADIPLRDDRVEEVEDYIDRTSSRRVSGFLPILGGSASSPVLRLIAIQEDERTSRQCCDSFLEDLTSECGKVSTAAEHSVIGGRCEAVCAVLSEKLPTPVRRVGVQDKFGCSGPAWDLLKLYGLDAATICKTAHEMLD